MTTKKYELSTFQNCSIGGIIGLFEVLVTNPFFVIKTNIQQKIPIRWTWQGLYAGATANALSFVPITAIQVGTDRWIEKHFFSNTPTYKQKIGSTFIAGVLSSVISCPAEMIMLLQNNTPNLSMTQAVKIQVQQQGISGLFIGQMATALRDGYFAVFFLAITPFLKNHLRPYCVNDTTASIAAGVLSGSIATLVSQPTDTIKTEQQARNMKSLGFFKTAKSMGFSNMFSGTLSRGSSVILSVTLMSWMREQLETYCLENNNSFKNSK